MAALERFPVVSSVVVILLAKIAMVVAVVVANALLGGPATIAGAALTVLLLALIPFAIWRILKRHGWAAVAGFNAPSAWREPWLIWLPALLVLVNLSNLLGATIDPSPDWRLVMDAAVRGITVPLVEESVFRGLVLAILLSRFHASRNQIVGCVLFSSLLFGLWHLPNPNVPWQMNVANVIYAFFIGVGFAAVVLRTRSIWLVMAVHALVVFGNGLVAALVAQRAGTIAELIAPERAWRSALLSIAVTVPLLFYGLWLLRDRRLTMEALPRQ